MNKVGLKREASIFTIIMKNSLENYIKSGMKRQEVEREVNLLFFTHSLDCIISPYGGLPPYKHGECKDLIVSQFYTGIFNCLDFPAGIIPNVRKVTKQDLEQDYTDIKWGKDNAVKLSIESMKGSEGFPIAI